MEGFSSSPDGINSIDYLNKKRKLQNELLEMPLPKHICCGQNADYDSSSNSGTEPNIAEESENFTSGNRSDQDSAKGSNSFNSNEDSVMSNDEESDTYSGYREIYPSDEPSTSSVSWGSSSSETRSSTKSTSVSDYKLESDHNRSFSEDGNDGFEQFMDQELEDLLKSNGIASNEYALSSGRWTVNQGTQKESKKLTIDKEFEQYFSMLML